MEIIQLFKRKLEEQQEQVIERRETKRERQERISIQNKYLEQLLDEIDVSDDKYFHKIRDIEEQILYLEILRDIEQ